MELRVTGRRDDGRHLLETTMTLLDWGDEIGLSGRVDGKIWPRWRHEHIDAKSELTMRAARLLKRETGTRMGADITVIKNIPVGAGMGGGSSNAAATLIGLNRLWRLKLKPADLVRHGATLGSDIPFFIFGKTARVSGALGLQMRTATAERWHFLIARPPLIAETKRVYEMYDLLEEGKEKADIPEADICDNNDLARAAMHCYPDIARAAAAVKAAAGKAGLSGSGAAVFAHFDSEEEAKAAKAKLPPDLPAIVAPARPRHPLGTMPDDYFDGESTGEDEPVYEGERPSWYKST